MRKILWLLLICSLAMVTSAQEDETVTAQDLADENGQFLEIDGIRIYTIEDGDSTNPAVILIHGFGGSTFTWRDNIGAIADAGYYVVALDLPPFGLSDKSPEIDHTRGAYADYVVGVMDALDIETATIIGHSMGGSTTAYFAVAYPERVEKLVFVAGGLFGGEIAIEADGDTTSPFGAFSSLELDPESMVEIIENSLIPATFAGLLRTAYFDPETMTDDAVEGYARPILLEGWAEGFVAYWLSEDVSDPITMDDLVSAVDVPVLIMWGEDDTWVPISMGVAMNEALDNATLVTYSEVGHLPMEEAIEDFNTDLIMFLDGE